MACAAVMHREVCEASWRSAGFRVLDRTPFLACCAMKGHKCWNTNQPDPPFLDDSVQPPKSALDKKLVEIVQSGELVRHESHVKAGNLIAAGANMETSM